MRRLPLVLFTLVLLIVLAGCSDDGGSPAAPAGGGEVDADESGGGDSGSGGVTTPSDFAIPTVDGAEVVIDQLPGIPDGAYLQLLYPGDRYDELVAFYEAWVGEQSVEWSPTSADTSTGAAWISLALEGEPGYGQSVLIAPPAASDGRASVTLIAELADG